jgi:hypothetical protein
MWRLSQLVFMFFDANGERLGFASKALRRKIFEKN